MKKIFILVFTMLCFTTSYAQKVKQEGKTFSSISTKKTSVKDSTKTDYTWRDSKDNTYPIYLTSSGAAYVPRVSKKTGKYYRQYLPKEVKEAINKNKK